MWCIHWELFKFWLTWRWMKKIQCYIFWNIVTRMCVWNYNIWSWSIRFIKIEIFGYLKDLAEKKNNHGGVMDWYIQRLKGMTPVKCVITCDKDLNFANKGSKWKYLTNDFFWIWYEVIILEYGMISCITSVCFAYKD